MPLLASMRDGRNGHARHFGKAPLVYPEQGAGCTHLG